MTFSSDKEIERIAKGVIDLSLPKPEWTHEAHFAAAVWVLGHPDMDAFSEMPGLIKAYNTATGVPNSETDGYHETITLASLRAAKHIMQTAPLDRPRFEAVNAIMQSDFGKPDWLLAYWSKEVLFSAKARKEWIAPDLAPLPF